MSRKPMKAGARHSASDQQHMDQAADHMYKAGANLPAPDKEAKAAAAARIRAGLAGLAESHKSIKSLDYAMAESWDIQNAAHCLDMLASIAAAEAAQGEGGDVEEVGAIIKALLVFIGGELQEMVDAAGQAAALECPMCGAGVEAGDKFCPMCGAPLAAEEPAMLSAPPKFALGYVKSLHLPHDEQYFQDVLAVKSTGADTVRGYTMLWGSPEAVDVEREYFTKTTDFWDATLATPKPLTWDHAQDPTLKAPAVIGQITGYGDDDIGRWYEAQLDRAHRYRKAVDKLIRAGALGTSSDSAPQYVVREKSARGATWLKCWPWFASALTTTPAEPRMVGTIEYFKSLGIALPPATLGETAQAAPSDVLGRVERAKRLERLLKAYS